MLIARGVHRRVRGWRRRAAGEHAAGQAPYEDASYPVSGPPAGSRLDDGAVVLTGEQAAKVELLIDLFADAEDWQAYNGRLLADRLRREPASDLMLTVVLLGVLDFARSLHLTYRQFEKEPGYRTLAEGLAMAVIELTSLHRQTS